MPVDGMKRTQVDGKQYQLPEEDIEIQKLVKRGLSIDGRIREMKAELDGIKDRLTEIARQRREGRTTVSLNGVSGTGVITFRESWEPSPSISEISGDLGKDLFNRFFTKQESFKTTKDLKEFLEGKHAYGLSDPEEVKGLILKYVTKKETKPNVKLKSAE